MLEFTDFINLADFCVALYNRNKLFDFRENYPISAFLTSSCKTVDFNFRFKDTDGSVHRKFVWGSKDFRYPTFLFELDDGYFDWIVHTQDDTPALSFRISPDWTDITLYQDNTNTKGADAFREYGSLFAYSILPHHACVLHGVVMEYEGRGILVTAASGVGKTTHTRMWRDLKNALILNGDRCLCRKKDGVWYAYGMPWSGSSGEYINRRVPISCIVCLRRGSENTVSPMPQYSATIQMMQRIFAPVWPGELQNTGFDLCEELAAEIPILDFACRPEPESVDVLLEAVLRYGK